MSREDIENLIGGSRSWNNATDEQRARFVNAMNGHQYGWDALTQAWGWFLTGWNASRGQ